MSDQPLKALSIQQPWAWLIVNGYKDVENRDWKTNVRGPVLIHASKKFDYEGWRWVRENFPHIPMPRTPEAFYKGGIVGEAEIVDCVSSSPSRWFFGRYGFVLKNAVAHSYRKCRGKLGFFVPDLVQEGKAA